LFISLHDVSWLSRRCRSLASRPFDTRMIPPEKAVRMGTKAKPPETGPHGGFAVCGFTATAAKYFDPLQ
jgi:hypothetical protein